MSQYHVVIVDDEQPNLESLERILKSDGATVALFRDPREALLYARKEHIDVLMTDLRMGSFSGLEVLETIKMLDPSIGGHFADCLRDGRNRGGCHEKRGI